MTRSFFPATGFLALSLAVALVPASAVAQSRGTAQDRKACNGDAKRYCKHVIANGDMAVYSCLQSNADKLKPACRQRVVGY